METTSTTLLRTIGSDAGSARWDEFDLRYRPAMEGFLRTNFPTAEMDDVIQEVFIALMKSLPDYRYAPDEKGHFRNWLMGIVRHKAEDQIRSRAKESEKIARMREDNPSTQAAFRQDVDWRRDAYESALAMLLADDAIADQTRRIFVRVAINGESPDAVADLFGVTRNNVDQIKNRLLKRLRELVERFVSAG